MTNAEKIMKINDYIAEKLADPEWIEMMEEYRDILEQRKQIGEPIEKRITREEILREAIRTVCEDRNTQYGEPEESFRVIAEFWTTYVREKCAAKNSDVCISPEDVGMMMVLFKAARAIGGTKADTYIDIAGYAACAGEIALDGNMQE